MGSIKRPGASAMVHRFVAGLAQKYKCVRSRTTISSSSSARKYGLIPIYGKGVYGICLGIMEACLTWYLTIYPWRQGLTS